MFWEGSGKEEMKKGLLSLYFYCLVFTKHTYIAYTHTLLYLLVSPSVILATAQCKSEQSLKQFGTGVRSLTTYFLWLHPPCTNRRSTTPTLSQEIHLPMLSTQKIWVVLTETVLKSTAQRKKRNSR